MSDTFATITPPDPAPEEQATATALLALPRPEPAASPASAPHRDPLWSRYFAERSIEVRNLLIERYVPLAYHLADRMHQKLPSEVDVDDLRTVAVMGLMNAVEAFDPDRGAKFETYCTPRIRGAVLDELRSNDWVPRVVRNRVGQHDQAVAALALKLGRQPSAKEIRSHLNLDEAEYEKISKDSRTVSVVSLNRLRSEPDWKHEVKEIDVLSDPKQPDPRTVVEEDDMRRLMNRGLSRSEQMILILYYQENLTMREIGGALDLSESRVSQMHASIMLRLRAQFQNRDDLQDA